MSARTALVTGGGSGIGAAVAHQLADDGLVVTVADRDAEAAERVAAEIGGKSWIVDLADTAALERELADGLDVDILVNNAGFQKVSPLEDFDPDTFRSIQRVMVEAPFLLIRAALRTMYERQWGRIINISSVHGLRASKHKVAYVTAKHALEGLSKTTALEGAEHGVTSNCVNPGFVRTPLVEGQIADTAAARGIAESEVLSEVLLADTAVKRLVEPSEVAAIAGFLATDQAATITGASWTIDGGWTAH